MNFSHIRSAGKLGQCFNKLWTFQSIQQKSIFKITTPEKSKIENNTNFNKITPFGANSIIRTCANRVNIYLIEFTPFAVPAINFNVHSSHLGLKHSSETFNWGYESILIHN